MFNCTTGAAVWDKPCCDWSPAPGRCCQQLSLPAGAFGRDGGRKEPLPGLRRIAQLL